MRIENPNTTWQGWKEGQFQVHFIHTGATESQFCIFPDGTSMLIDCGDFDPKDYDGGAGPVFPDASRHSGEWVARYVLRVNPKGKAVDYMMLTHYHDDHAGCASFNAGVVERDGKPYPLSGFSQAAEFLDFGKAFDRAWPTYDDPIPMRVDPAIAAAGRDGFSHIRRFYDYMTKHRGLQVEKFRLGASDQIVMRRRADAYPSFRVQNICANGRIIDDKGTVTDLYKERIEREKLDRVSENGMSLGMIFHYGPFRFYSAGDFSDGWIMPDGSWFEIETAQAPTVPTVNVAKFNHHGACSYGMPVALVKALRAQAYVACVWHEFHVEEPSARRCADRATYPDDRIICAGYFSKRRREMALGANDPWIRDVPEPCFEGCHIVLTVEPGGEDFSLSFITARDESMIVREVRRFKTNRS